MMTSFLIDLSPPGSAQVSNSARENPISAQEAVPLFLSVVGLASRHLLLRCSPGKRSKPFESQATARSATTARTVDACQRRPPCAVGRASSFSLRADRLEGHAAAPHRLTKSACERRSSAVAVNVGVLEPGEGGVRVVPPSSQTSERRGGTVSTAEFSSTAVRCKVQPHVARDSWRFPHAIDRRFERPYER